MELSRCERAVTYTPNMAGRCEVMSSGGSGAGDREEVATSADVTGAGLYRQQP